MKLPVPLLAVALTAICFPFTTNAQSLRCKGDLAAIGDSKASILRKCGDPAFRDSFCAPVKQEAQLGGAASGSATVNVQQCENVDEWTYNPGYGQFLTTLQFKGGNLSSIRYGDRVK